MNWACSNVLGYSVLATFDVGLDSVELGLFAGRFNGGIDPIVVVSIGLGVGNAADHSMVKACKGLEHGWGDCPCLTSVQEDCLHNGYMEAASCFGRCSLIGEHSGDLSPFLSCPLEVAIDGGPVVVGVGCGPA